MSKFASSAVPDVRHPIAATTPTVNHEGSPAWSLTPQAELFLLCATNMVEATFYETAKAHDARFISLIQEVTATDPEWIRRFAPYLRSQLKIRSASVMLACEYVRAGGEFGRSVVNSVCQRPDEPAEVLGYWLSKYGRALPKAVKRGVADAATRLYSEASVIKWDGNRAAIGFADVIEMTHPTPASVEQARLFHYLLDARHHKDGSTDGLAMLKIDADLLAAPEDERRVRSRSSSTAARWPWERVAGWLPGGMDAEAWEGVIPNMGVMALIRNLRNFDAAGISESAIDAVTAKLTDPKAGRTGRYGCYRSRARWPPDQFNCWGLDSITCRISSSNSPATSRPKPAFPELLARVNQILVAQDGVFPIGGIRSPPSS